MRRIAGVVTAIAVPSLALPLAAAPAALAHDPGGGGVQVVTSHLDNPRGLAFHDGRVWVAESGHGGTVCIPVSATETSCIGLTGAITRVSGDLGHGKVTVRHVVTGLFSIAGPGGTEAGGPSDVALRDDRILAIMAGNTSGLPTTVPASAQPLIAAAKAQLGQLIKATPSGSFRPVAGVGDFDFAWSAAHKNLNPQFPDSNPNALLPVGDRVYVIDAGANTLDVVSGHRIKVLAYFPVPAGSPTDAVPTCIDRGPDGALYVGELLGGTFAPGHARVWRVVPGHKPRVWATGLTAVNGCGFGPDGSFYATEFEVNGLNPTGNPAGDVVRIDRHHNLTHLAVGHLSVPSGFTADKHAIYVSNCSIAPATGFGPCASGGQLVRITVPHHG